MSTSIRTLHDKAAARLGSIITESFDSGSQPLQRSPELLELIIWNVAVAFGVNLGAGAALDGLKTALGSARLGRQQLKEHQKAIDAEVLEAMVDRPRVEAAVRDTLVRYNVKADLAVKLAPRLTDVLINCLTPE